MVLPTNNDIDQLKNEFLELLESKAESIRYNKFSTFFPDTGPFARSKYKKHVQFMNAGKDYMERAFIAANRCFAANTQVMMANGTRKNIQDIKIGEYVSGYDKQSDTLIPIEVINTFKGTANNLVTVGTYSGDIVTVTDDHNFLYKSGRNVLQLKQIKNILSNSHRRKVVIPSKWNPIQTKLPYEKDLARFIGYLIGDGSITTALRFTNTDSFYIDDICSIARKYELRVRNTCNTGDYYFSVPDCGKGGNWFINILRSYGLWGKTSINKFIPHELLTAPIEYVEELLKGLLATDGCVSNNKFSYYTSSPRLAKDLQVLFLRLGIVATCYSQEYDNVNHNTKYVVQVSSKTFLQKIPSWGRKNINIRNNKTNRQLNDKYIARDIKFIKNEPSQDVYCITVDHPDHLFIANGYIVANCGKTICGAYETTCHLTGIYPEWWEGKRFINPTDGWAAGDTSQTTRDILQKELLGDLNEEEFGTGMIPKHLIIDIVRKPGGGEAVEKVRVRHISGGMSILYFKSYEQGRKAFQGTKKSFIWLDEEPTDKNIYTECLTRTADKFNSGIIYCTFTPLNSLTDIVLAFIPGGRFPEGGVNPKNPYKYVVNVDWSDIPHMNEEDQKRYLAAYSESEKYARSMGMPGMGAGAIYPYPEQDISVTPFKIPDHWPKAYGLDVGWNKTACVWGAMDPDSKMIYLYSEHYEGFAQPVIHAKAIKARGDWMRGVIDIASSGSSQADGRKLADLYCEEGLFLDYGDNTIEAGLVYVGQLFVSGRLKIFSTLNNLLDEYRVYRKDENGKIVKKNDHLMDAMRYLLMSFDDIAEEIPDPDYVNKKRALFGGAGRNDVTGY